MAHRGYLITAGIAGLAVLAAVLALRGPSQPPRDLLQETRAAAARAQAMRDELLQDKAQPEPSANARPAPLPAPLDAAPAAQVAQAMTEPTPPRANDASPPPASPTDDHAADAPSPPPTGTDTIAEAPTALAPDTPPSDDADPLLAETRAAAARAEAIRNELLKDIRPPLPSKSTRPAESAETPPVPRDPPAETRPPPAETPDPAADAAPSDEGGPQEGAQDAPGFPLPQPKPVIGDVAEPAHRDVTPRAVTQAPRQTGPLVRVEGMEPLATAPSVVPVPVSSPPQARTLTLNQVVVEAAGTLREGDTVVALAHVAPLALEQSCTAKSGKTWPCGKAARTALRKLIRGRPVICTPVSSRAGGAGLHADCSVANEDLANWLIRYGWATPDDAEDTTASKMVAEAKAAGRGQWRDGNQLQAPATSVPRDGGFKSLSDKLDLTLPQLAPAAPEAKPDDPQAAPRLR